MLVNKIPTKRRVLFICGCVVLGLIIASLSVPYVLVANQRKYVHTTTGELTYKNSDVILVLGGGINEDGTPKPILQNRLNAAKELFATGNYKKIIVSGDNRYDSYNEPAAMKSYLNGKGIQENDIQEDYAGRSTYESCERAKKIFGLQRVVIVSQASHLPRAIYLCKSFGLQAEGLAATDVSGIAKSQKIRELFANVKAVGNVYLLGEKTILGDPITL